VNPVGVVQAGRLNIRPGPGLHYGVITVVSMNDTLELTGRTGDKSWLRVRLPVTGQEGWAASRYVWSRVPLHTLPVVGGGYPLPAPEPVGLVIPYHLNLRSGPGLNYRIVGRLYGGQEVHLLGRTATADWLKVDLPDGRSGWVAARYVRTYGPIHNLPVIGDRPSTRRIRFEPGATSATRWGSLSTTGIDPYVLTALAGQTMTVEVTASPGQALLSISGANGEVYKSSGAGSSRWSGVLPLTQDYFITISAAGSNPVTHYTLQVVISPL
jgi:uncharacterized protein YraI